MPKSETLGKLAEALAKAQGEIQHAHKDKDNPFFKSSYADLASVWDACREPLSKNGLCVVQTLESEGVLILNTTLMHASGEWVSSQVPIIPVKNDPQGLGSAITYMRRFSLAALVGVAPSEKPNEQLSDDDDDGEAAMGRKPMPSVSKPIVREPVYRPAVQPKVQPSGVNLLPGWNFDAEKRLELRSLIEKSPESKAQFKEWERTHGTPKPSEMTEEYYNGLRHVLLEVSPPSIPAEEKTKDLAMPWSDYK